jgi:hypothetical protein
MDHMQEHVLPSEEKYRDTAAHVQPADARLVAAKPAQDASSPQSAGRVRTRGEQVFDYSIYGGISFLANEILSGKIQNQTIEKEGRFHRFYQKSLKGLHGLFRQSGAPGQWQNWIKRPTDIFVMTLGGTLLVPIVKFFEAHKSDLVRFYDKTFHGQRMAEDPAIQAAHEAMDREPQQSWGSLWKARVVIIGAAIGVDALMGSRDAVSTKIWDNNWSSMHRINTHLTRKVAGFFQPEYKHAILEAANASPHDILASEGRIANIGKTYGFLLILSAALAAGFYASSRIFARRREEHRLYQHLHGQMPATDHAATPAPAADAMLETSAAMSPATQVRDVHRESQLQPMQQLSAGVV